MDKLNQVAVKNNKLEKYYSFKGNFWSERNHDKTLFNSLKNKFPNEDILLQLLVSRNIALQDIDDFINPKLKNLLPDPHTIDDMKKASDKICNFIKRKKKIGIFGDYDVDGSSSTAIVCNYLKSIGATFEYYIPDRIGEGYGPNKQAFDILKEKKCELILTLDCGTSSNEEINHANSKGIDIIVVDHHLEGDKLPDAFAIVNPNKKADKSNLNNLCAAGVVFFLIISINRSLKENNFFTDSEPPNLLKLLDLVALGTICDLVQLDLVNRALVKQGIKVMNKLLNSGIKSLVDCSSIKDEISEYHLGFVLGPRINAAGRVGDSKLGATLLINNRNDLNLSIAEKLNYYNQLRKKIEKKVELQAINQANNNSEEIICVHSKDWHPGVIGIVAGKLTENFKRPSIVISEDENVCKASCRSVKNFHMGDFIIKAVRDGFLISGGGHEMAGGFSILKEKIESFKDYIKNKFSVSDIHHEKNYDLEINLSSVNLDLYKSITKLQPYGMGNPKPKFLIRNCIKTFVKPAAEIHLIVNLNDIYGNSIKSIAFNCIQTEIAKILTDEDDKELDIICTLQLNRWNGNENVELIIEDILKR